MIGITGASVDRVSAGVSWRELRLRSLYPAPARLWSVSFSPEYRYESRGSPIGCVDGNHGAADRRVRPRRGRHWLWDHTGRKYLDFVQGWAVNCLGHSPATVVEALTRQAQHAHHAQPGVLQRAQHPARQGADRGIAAATACSSPTPAPRLTRGAIKLARKYGGAAPRAAPTRSSPSGRLSRPHTGHHVGIGQAEL